MRVPDVLWAAVAVLATGSSTAGAGILVPQAPTFNRDIAPILLARCGSCHRPDGPAPFPLLTYRSAVQRARQIADVTRRRVMPPWQVTPGVNQFRGKEPLTNEEIAVIERWVAWGAPEGAPDDLPVVETVVTRIDAPDLVVTLPTPFMLAADGFDVFQAFAIAVPLDGSRFVKSVEFRPANPVPVHHADMLFDRTARSRLLIDRQENAEGLLPRSAESPPGYLLGWTPGQSDARHPGDLAWRLDQGTDLIVQLHMVPTGKPESVTFSVAFYFADRPPLRTPAMLRLSRQDLRIAPGESDRVVTDSYLLPVAVDLLSVRPHAHYRARAMTAWAELPDGTTQQLLAIEAWDFRWQHTYEYAAPIALPEKTRISMRYAYDNSPDHVGEAESSRPVHWGPMASDEMADLWLQVLPRTAGDLDRLTKDFRRKALTEDVRGYETLLEAGRQRTLVHEDLAATRMELGQYALAIPHLATVVASNPASATAHYNLAVALARGGRFEEAIAEYGAALARDRHRSDARFNLANLLDQLDRPGAAVAEYRELLRLEPGHAPAHTNLAFVLMRTGRGDEALSHLTDAVRLDPSLADAHYNLGVLLASRGQSAGARTALRRALGLRPDWPSAMAQLAWMLATTPDAGPDEASEAIVLANRAVALSAMREPALLDVLAAAYAASGRFDQAIQVLEEALAGQPEGPERAAMFERSRMYREHRPFRRSQATRTKGA